MGLVTRIVKIRFYFSNNLRCRMSKTPTETRVLGAVDYQLLETFADINIRIQDFLFR
jgi:hypothetical protein